MKVLKFGGTSVGTVDSLQNVKKIVETIGEEAVVVVSALGGLTDKLIETAGKASKGDDSFRDEMSAIKVRHHKIIENVIDEDSREECSNLVDNLLEELGRIYEGIRLICDLPEKTLDQVVSFGERMSSVIVSRMIPAAAHLDSLEIVKTEKWFGKNIADARLTTENIKVQVKPLAGKPIIMGGFISTDRDNGEITNLGRGGSDFTAALVAAALDADSLEIWTDVDGFMTSDPRIIPEARIIPKMSFVESMELCSFGAKVIYPPTIYPVFHKNIPIKILNTFNIEAPGTLIKDFSSKDLHKDGRVRGLSALKGMAIINISGSFAQNLPATAARTFNALAKRGISVYLVSPTEEEDCFSFSLRMADITNAIELLKAEFAPEIASGSIQSIEPVKDLAVIAVVGEDILSHGNISPRIVNSLQRAQIPVLAISEGASKTTVTIAVPEPSTNDALRIIHSLFY